MRDQEVFCPNKYNNCYVCKSLTEVYENLKDCYFFSPRKDMPYQPIFLANFLANNATDHKNGTVFRAEIGKTVKGTGRVYHRETC